jgi:arylsulfatase A-like enzyme
VSRNRGVEVEFGNTNVLKKHWSACFYWSLLVFLCWWMVFQDSGMAGQQPQSERLFNGKIGLSAEDSTPDWSGPVTPPAGAPNIVLILLDDVGYAASDLFGGPVQMPELNKLAANGLRYNRFHVAALCSPTRAALLSGRNDHQVGFGVVSDVPKGFPGYNGVWPKSVAPVSEVLRRNGYSTAAFGKWHNTPYWEINPTGPFDRWPTGLGFEYFYGFMKGFDSQWWPASLYRNTVAVEPAKTPDEGYSFTADITDEAINWLHTHEAIAPQKPYFLYFAASGTHSPLQAPKEWIDKYRGKFDQGWDKLREDIFEQQKKLGVIPAGAELTPRPAWIPEWDKLSADQKRISIREMQVFSGYLAFTDHEVGRLLKAVQEGPRGENTLIIYIAGDNGAEGTPIVPDRYVQKRLRHLDQLGGPQSTEDALNSRGWAWATSTPFKGLKGDASHFGGTRAPMIISWPGHTKSNEKMRSQFTHANDIAPTLYSIANIQFPQEIDGVKQVPLVGVSFADTFEEPDAPSHHRTQIFEQMGSRAIYQDGWIATAAHNPWAKDYSQDDWELYNLNEDFSESRNVAEKFPSKVNELKELFDAEARKNNIYPFLSYGGKKASALIDSVPDFSFMRSVMEPVAGRMPHLTASAAARRDYVYRPGLPRLPGWVMPNFTNSSYVFTADATIPSSGAQGVLVSCGSNNGGFALYVKDDHLIYESNPTPDGKEKYVVKSDVALPRGKTVLGLAFDMKEKTEGPETASGVVHLYINGKKTGEGVVRVSPDTYLGSFGVGQAFGSPVSTAFEPPFKFSGTLERLQLKMLH